MEIRLAVLCYMWTRQRAERRRELAGVFLRLSTAKAPKQVHRVNKYHVLC
jgi:hypothetical protein